MRIKKRGSTARPRRSSRNAAGRSATTRSAKRQAAAKKRSTASRAASKKGPANARGVKKKGQAPARSRKAAKKTSKSPLTRVKQVVQEVAQQATTAVTDGVETLKDLGANLVDRVTG